MNANILNNKEWEIYKKNNTYTLKSFIDYKNIDINDLNLNKTDYEIFLKN